MNLITVRAFDGRSWLTWHIREDNLIQFIAAVIENLDPKWQRIEVSRD